ncbi:MAG: hypothetical protein IPN61_10950 [Bacteroidetes bacterium]|nr:hypothetical protein [Bacteroidota bacterium]
MNSICTSKRFINPFRANPPDFDIDFSWTDRDDVTDYIFRRHGKKMLLCLVRIQRISRMLLCANRKVFGLPKGEIDATVENSRHPDTPDKITKAINYFSMRCTTCPIISPCMHVEL